MSSSVTKPAVLIIRLSAMGDIVMASGLPSSLKQHFDNDVTISWLVESPYAALVAGHPDVDNVITWPKQEWRVLAKKRQYFTLFKALLRFRRTLRALRFDLVVDAQGLLKSALLAWFTGARKRVGFNSKEHSQWFLTQSFDKPLSDDISSEYKFLASKFSNSPYQLSLEVSEKDRTTVHNQLNQEGFHGNFIVIAPFTTRPQKHWLIPYWHELIAMLGNNGYQVIILGGPSDKQSAEHLASGNPHCLNLAGSLSLTQSAAVIEQCAALLGVDTGLTHMGMVYQRPTVAIFGSTRPYTQTQNPHARILYADLSCAPCKRRPVCDGRFDCMQAITPGQVFTTLQGLQ
ncbi:MAG: glycosyltransferase family 9 protein [Gammaproteobacteria bacterium]|nr:glycosyltransferase family 9 protein [Gammaproteobacteria bacterium]